MTERKLEWRWIFDAITAVSVVVGVTIGAVELRQLRAAQESQTVLQLYQTLQDPNQVRGRDLLLQLPDTISQQGVEAALAGPDGQQIRQAMLSFEGMGVMVYRGDISIEWVDELFHFVIVSSWKKLAPAVVARRKQAGYPGLMEWMQWLAERLEERTGRAEEPAYVAHRDWKPHRD